MHRQDRESQDFQRLFKTGPTCLLCFCRQCRLPARPRRPRSRQPPAGAAPAAARPAVARPAPRRGGIAPPPLLTLLPRHMPPPRPPARGPAGPAGQPGRRWAGPPGRPRYGCGGVGGGLGAGAGGGNGGQAETVEEEAEVEEGKQDIYTAAHSKIGVNDTNARAREACAHRREDDKTKYAAAEK